MPTSGFRKRSDYQYRNLPADEFLEQLRAKLLAKKEAMGVSFIDISRHLKPSGPSRQQAEMALKTGGFRGLARIAHILGLRVEILLHED